MKKVNVIFVLLFFVFSCAEEGQSGSSPLDCGEYGSVHDDHCDCDEGAFFNGQTCVLAAEIVNVCVDYGHYEDHEDHEDHEEHEDHDDHDEHDDHSTCFCPAQGECPCDHGEVITFEGKQYCVPVYHN